MSVRKSSLIALRALRRNRLQTALTILGMTIGVGTVLVMVAVGTGAETSILGQVRAAGMNVILVNAGNYKMQQQWTSQGEAEEPAAFSPLPSHPHLQRIQYPQNEPGSNPIQEKERDGENLAGLGGATTLSLDDAMALAAMPGIQAVSGGLHENATASFNNETWLTQIRGEQASLAAIRRAWVFPHGRFFTPAEDQRGEPVAVLGSIVAEKLFGPKNPVGEQIQLRSRPYKVVGVTSSGSWMVPSAPGDGQFDAIYLPTRTAQRLFKREHLDTLTLSTESTGDVARMTKVIREQLRSRHHLTANLPDDFTVASQARAAIARGGMRTDISRAMVGNADGLDKVTLAQLSKTLEQAGRTMAVLLAAIAGVSLVVGGIGIMNIMLLSVTERTREIGIRRAVGARSDEVMQQFLLEAVLLSLTGGILGIVLGLTASTAVARLVQWSTSISPLAILFSFAVSAGVGILFGYYPARQASRVTPMTSLRYE